MRRFNLNGKYEFCPNGNYWQDISGVFDEKLYLFCDCKKCKGKVYELRPIDITKKIKKDVIDKARKMNELDELRGKINLKNMENIKKLI